MIRLLLSLFILVFGVNSWSQGKHPRVVELEDLYKKQAVQYLESRFPGIPFTVIVSIDPLRRATGYKDTSEELPFYVLDEEEIRDEWDNPKSSLYVLSQRVKKVKVTIHVPENIEDSEVSEIQATLSEVLRLTPARDEVQILKRKWNMFLNLKDYAIFGAVAMMVFLFGLLIILRSSASKMATSLGEMQSAITKASGANSGVSSNTRSGLENHSQSRSQKTKKEDIQFTDPIKTREVIGKRIGDLLEKDDFLRLENIIMMDELAQSDPHALGALLVNFPIEVQEKLFSYSTGSNWMEAFVYPGELDSRCLHLVEELYRVKPHRYREQWEKLLIQVWRLGSLREKFLKTLKLDQALAILNSMPKFIAVPTARSVFPGNWAAVIDPEYSSIEIEEDQCGKLFLKALDLKPLNGFDQLNVYKQSKELLKYLKSASVREEQEVYQVLPENSTLALIRPPFYVLFDLAEEPMQQVVKEVALDDWALALFDVPRDLRSRIEKYFSEKERFLFLEKLRFLDNNRRSLEEVGEIRESIAIKVGTQMALFGGLEEKTKNSSDVSDKNDESSDKSNGKSKVA
ncbi:MAG: hypothetical protein KDD50_06700 [Bdellovibrionales bacterium]|nr:hypothetical protein [Bdellovibrionales bacterium]